MNHKISYSLPLVLFAWGALCAPGASAKDLKAEPPAVGLHWMDAQGNLLELKWKLRARWIWRQKSGVGWEPWLQIGVTVPPPLSLLEAEDAVEPAEASGAGHGGGGWADEGEVEGTPEGDRLLIETQAPEVTRKVRIEDLDEQVSEGAVAVRAGLSRPALLVHSSCRQLGMRIAPVLAESKAQALPSFLFFGVSCVRQPDGAVQAHWFTSADAALVGTPAFTKLVPPAAEAPDSDRTFVVSVGEKRVASTAPGDLPGSVLTYEVQWEPVVRRAKVPHEVSAQAAGAPSFVARPLAGRPAFGPEPEERTLSSWVPAFFLSDARGFWSIALRTRHRTAWGEVWAHLPLVSVSPAGAPAEDIYQVHAGFKLGGGVPVYLAALAQYSHLTAIPEVEGVQAGPRITAVFEKAGSRWGGRLSAASLYGSGGATLSFGAAVRATLGIAPLLSRRVDLVPAVDYWLYRVGDNQPFHWLRYSLGVKVWL